MIAPVDLTIDTPPAAPEPRPGEAVHPLACYHRKWRVALAPATAAFTDAVVAVEATLTDEQRHAPAWAELDAAFGLLLCAQQDHLVEVLQKHFPGIGPAIRAVAYHADDDMDGTGTAICCWPNERRPDGV